MLTEPSRRLEYGSLKGRKEAEVDPTRVRQQNSTGRAFIVANCDNILFFRVGNMLGAKPARDTLCVQEHSSPFFEGSHPARERLQLCRCEVFVSLGGVCWVVRARKKDANLTATPRVKTDMAHADAVTMGGI